MFRRGSKAPYLRAVKWPRAWKRAPMKLLKWGRKMPSTKQYNPVPNDVYDVRIPLHPDEAFKYGITFNAKYIGTMDVPRPTSRVEIVAAMRKVRYEFKARGVKKRKVTINISTNGVRISARQKKQLSKKNQNTEHCPDSSITVDNDSKIMDHPIYRIFYVSHDSSDLKIFSYIARDEATNVFKCNVFKSNRKSQAMKIVRTVGQAFEVCHKMQVAQSQSQCLSDQPAPSTSSTTEEHAPVDRATDAPPPKEAVSDCGASESGAASTTKVAVEERAMGGGGEEQARPKHLDLLPPPPRKTSKRSPQRTTTTPNINLPDLPECVTKVDVASSLDENVMTPLSAQHQLQLLRERLDQQAQQTRAAVAQLLLLRDQLAAEQAARCEAQSRTHQLLVHNKELLEHIAALVAHLQERERGSCRPISAQQLTLLPQAKVNGEVNDLISFAENLAACNGNLQQFHTDSLVNLISHNNRAAQSVENNNPRLISPFSPGTPDNGISLAPPFSGMTNEQIQNYLISKFEKMSVIANGATEHSTNNNGKVQQFYQNRNAFPNIPPLSNHFSNADLAALISNQTYKEPGGATDEFWTVVQPMSLGQSDNSICSHVTTSKDSSPDSSEEGAAFIMPLSHVGTLTATGEDGRVRLIVPVSPSGSTSDVPELATTSRAPAGPTLLVPGASASSLATPAGPITRSTSERVPNRSEMMTALRSQWTRHTTK